MGKTLKQSSSGSVRTYSSDAFPSNANCNAVTRGLEKYPTGRATHSKEHKLLVISITNTVMNNSVWNLVRK